MSDAIEQANVEGVKITEFQVEAATAMRSQADWQRKDRIQSLAPLARNRPMTSSAGDSRMSSMSRLYAMPDDEDARSVQAISSGRSARRRSASATSAASTPLTCPASSMNRGSKPVCFAFHEEIERIDRDAVAAEARARDRTA